MGARPSLEEIWASAKPNAHVPAEDTAASLPEAARRYLDHALGSGRATASAARLRMHGEIKLGRWLPFEAKEVIHADRGMVWEAAVKRGRLTIRGYDRLVDGRGAMKWKMLRLIPVMSAAGPDITRSAAGRFAAELIWLPSALARSSVRWSGEGPNTAVAHVAVGAEQVDLHLRVADTGALQSMSLLRWGNPEGGAYRYALFGGVVERQGTFEGHTIPTKLRVGWHFGTARFDDDGEFFRVEIEHAAYR